MQNHFEVVFIKAKFRLNVADTERNIITHYDNKYSEISKLSERDEIKETNTPDSRFEAVKKYFPRYFKGGNILEIGAGDGRVAKTILKKCSSITEYIGSEFSLPRIKSLEINVNDSRFKVMELNVESIPPETYLNKYDAIIMIALIEHLIDPLRVMQNLRKMLKPGGFVYIDTPNIAKYSNRLKLLRGKFPSTASKNEGLTTYDNKPVDLYDEGHLHYFTYSSLSRMLIEYCEYSSVVKLGYHIGKGVFGKKIHNFLSVSHPELFSELLLLAYR